MFVTIKYMLRPVAHCKEGCSTLSWARRFPQEILKH
jgi:hypothetical protein